MMHSKQTLRGGVLPSDKSGGRATAHRLQRSAAVENRATQAPHTWAVGQLRQTAHWLGNQPVKGAKLRPRERRLTVRRINEWREVGLRVSIYSGSCEIGSLQTPLSLRSATAIRQAHSCLPLNLPTTKLPPRSTSTPWLAGSALPPTPRLGYTKKWAAACWIGCNGSSCSPKRGHIGAR